MGIYVWMHVLTIWENVGYIAVFCQLLFLGWGSCALTWPSCLGLCRCPGFACIWSVGAFHGSSVSGCMCIPWGLSVVPGRVGCRYRRLEVYTGGDWLS